MRFNDGVLGIFFAVVAVAVILHSRTFPTVPGRDFGSAVFPQIIGAGMLICSILLMISGWRERGRMPWIVLPPWVRSPRHLGNVLLVVATLLFYILASDSLGFLVAGGLVLVVLMSAFGLRVWWALALAVPVTLGIQLFFGSLLRVPLPPGILRW